MTQAQFWSLYIPLMFLSWAETGVVDKLAGGAGMWLFGFAWGRGVFDALKTRKRSDA